MIGIMRFMVGDFNSPYEFSDLSLRKCIIAGASRLLSDAQGSFLNNYSISFNDVSIEPDPTIGIRDERFISLCLISACCIVDSARVRENKNKGVLIKEFGTTIDTREFAAGLRVIYEKGWCKIYQDSIFEHLFLSSANYHSILSPFTTAYYNRVNDLKSFR
ncbi:MAG: hypothetical protein SNJ71_00375 [Bacteroidales bacterium]